MKKITLAIATFLILAIVLVTGCSTFGANPTGDDLIAIQKSAHYSAERNAFVNRKPDVLDEMKERTSFSALLKTFFSDDGNQSPSQTMPEIRPDIEDFLASSDKAKVIWFGHSTFLLNLSGTIILVDPIFSNTASPFSLLVKRFQPPVLPLEELPKIDFILISHDHYDHLDMKTVIFFKEKDTRFIAPLGVGSHLKSWGIDPEHIVERDWWESHSAAGVTFTATPAQHFSGRDGINENQTLWASWVIKTQQHNLYFSGDSGYDTHFKTIGEKYGPFDLAFLENGQYNPLWKEVHLLPNETVQAFNDLNAQLLFPIHWGMFDLSTHAWNEPVDQLIIEANGTIPMVIPKLGELVVINDEYQSTPWWRF